MGPKLFSIVLVGVAIVAVVALSVFPMQNGTGSYQSVNGPTTVFQAFRSALLLTMILLAAGAVTMHRWVPAVEIARAAGRLDQFCLLRQ
jgi:hypothetical protein